MNRVAKWNGSSWSGFANGVNKEVHAIAVIGTTIYIGGIFDVTCGNAPCNSQNTTVNHIAKWNGATWSALGNGVSSGVNALAATSSEAYAGGDFQAACGNADCNSSNVTVNRVAKYGAVEPPPPTPTPSPTPTSPNPCNAKPAKPTLNKPADGAAPAKAKVALKWNDVTCETKYVAIVKQGTNLKVFKKPLGADITTVKTDALPSGKTYKWFVKACNTFGCAKSTPRTFTLNP